MQSRFVFAGNRSFVFERALKLGIEFCRVFAEPDSYFSHYCDENHIRYDAITTKEALINSLEQENFSCFISNGLKYILPITRLSKESNRKFINIHPSLLPDLRGRHPVTGAILYGRNAGATCHFMDDGIDTGRVIAQCLIPMSEDLTADLLYQLSFNAEADVFEIAFKRNFECEKEIQMVENPIYYSRDDSDLLLDAKEEGVDSFCRKVRAFGAPGLCARVVLGGELKKIAFAKPIENVYVLTKMRDVQPGCKTLEWRGPTGVSALLRLKNGVVLIVFAN